VGDPWTPEQSARYQLIVHHLQEHFSDRLPENNPALNHLHRKLGEFAGQWNANTFYYPGSSIIQTSGSGKSKTVCALSQLGVFVIYCSFMGQSATGYPKRSSVADILADANDTTQIKEEQFIKYYLYWLEELYKFLEKIEVEHGALSSENIPDTAIQFLRNQAKMMINVKKRISFESIDQKQGIFLCSYEIVLNYFNKCVQNLSRFFALKPQKDPLRLNRLNVLFVFDEARELIPKPKSQSHPFACMRRMAGYFPDHCGLFVLLLDTASRVSNMAPGAFHDPSARARSLENKLYPPIYTIDTMDILREKNYENYELKELFKPHIRYRFGRPLWGALMMTPIRDSDNMDDGNKYYFR
jgi:hypothetical protein